MGGSWLNLTKLCSSLDNTHQSTRRRFSSQSKKSMKSGRKGQNLVEFGIVIPLLLLILFGAIDLGRLFHASITITNAARVAARYVTMNPFPDEGTGQYTTAKNLAVQEAQDSGIQVVLANVSDPICSVEYGRCASYGKVTMSVSYDFQLLLGPVFPGGYVVPGYACPDGRNLCFTLTRTAEMLVQ